MTLIFYVFLSHYEEKRKNVNVKYGENYTMKIITEKSFSATVIGRDRGAYFTMTEDLIVKMP